jgi:L-ascorbate metabolism protein UlaG (beta-lactamase superfamily)
MDIGIARSEPGMVQVGLVLGMLLAFLLPAAAQPSARPLVAPVAQPLVAPVAQPLADRCLAVSQAPPATQPASFRRAALQPNEVRLDFVGHATWLIESPAGVRIATDYNDYVRPAVIPDVATMNRAHTTHYSNIPDPAIKQVLRGWNPEGGPVKHDLTVGDVRIRNVATNIRDWNGGYIPYGNSIFIFELAGLCIAHLGHLHHTLTDQQIAQIGQLDVVMVPVDGSYTMDVAGMVEVLKVLRARLILPMHYFNPFTLERFVDRIRNDFPVEMAAVASIVVSQSTLPLEPKVLVLPGH